MISLFVKKIFEVYPTQNILRYLPQRDQKCLVKYRLYDKFDITSIVQ